MLRTRHAALAFGIWTALAALVAAIASVPQYRPEWAHTVDVSENASGILSSEPIGRLTTPYISFIALTLQTPPPADMRAFLAAIVGGSAAPATPADLEARSIVQLYEPLVSGDRLVYKWTSTHSLELPLGEASRIAIVPRSGAGAVPAFNQRTSGTVTFGYEGALPSVTAIAFWWPWILGAWAIGVALLLRPSSGERQRVMARAVAGAWANHGRLLALLTVAGMIRLLLAWRGGQYFDGDELRYGDGATTIFGLLSTGNLNAALEALLRSPDHPGFRIVSLVPAFFHVVSAWRTGHPISDMRFHTGEWLPAFVLSLSSVGSIGLTYLIALRTGSSRAEAFLAALLMFCSSSMVLYGRQFLPYDASMALLLLALWIGVADDDGPLRSYAVGLIAGFAFLTYEGYWVMVVAVGLLHIFNGWLGGWRWLRRGVLFAAAVLTLPTLLELVGRWKQIAFLAGMREFSKTVTHGDYSEGWRLPWAYLWNAEHALLIVYVGGALLAVGYVRRIPDAWRRRRIVSWALAAAGIYLSLGIGSSLLRQFVVYDRLVRQVVPFLSLAAAAGLTTFLQRKTAWQNRTVVAAIGGVLVLLFVINATPLLLQRFPREIAADAVATYGRGNIRLASTLPQSVSDLDSRFLPFAGATGQERYVLVNAKDIWLDAGDDFVTSNLPAGATLMQARHPRQLRSLQYHGYTARQRTFLRGIDFSIRLIDTGRR